MTRTVPSTGGVRWRWLRSLVAFGCAAGCTFAAIRLEEKPTSSLAQRQPVVDPASIDIDRIDLVTLERDGTRYRFERRNNLWQQTEPVPHAVDGWSMRQLISRVLKLETVRQVELPTSDDAAREALLAAAGLSPAAARIELAESGTSGVPARAVTVELGRRSLAGRAYARLAGDTNSYEVVDAALHEFALGRDPKEFRRRDLFVELGDVDRVTFRTAAGELVLARQARAYRLESPVKSRADRVQVEELLDALRRAKSAGFVSDRPAELSAYGLSPAMATLELDSAGTRRTLLIGDAVSIGAQDRFGMIDGTSTVVRLPAAMLAVSLPRIERLLDAVASGIRARDVAGIELSIPSASPSPAQGETPASSTLQRLTLRRETSGWSAVLFGPGSGKGISGMVESDAVDRLLKALTETRAGSVEVSAYPSAESIGTVTFVGFAGEPLDSVRIARRALDSKVLLENGDGVLRVHGAIDLPLSAEELGFRAAVSAEGAAAN